ncbi:hypothetical protein FVEN_g1116 [Fusarium venenatum]|uniref:Uncharacterized protein n=1 Tax=Fusarium venenatum TaxID=56646 RepID=A0A2L2U4Y8_9HYPO|nr:uncharacterized protein FVRRES_10452 [Fusarium venenatum]KAG8361416.1 hypothetical protein FVEN_g1116 [Fusarium venenatum]KAH6967056.1 hypothetical protein EDB82DRAFT_517876 [Fusarium venenatum]CEI70375.1 unnamed protein product [Fusarium venenatum]
MDGPENCPEGETRGAKELVVKLIVAHLTAVVAFCHLQSLRNERLDTIEPVLFLLSPFIVVFQTALGLVTIHCHLIESMLRSPKSWPTHMSIYARHWSLLFARKPTPRLKGDDDYRSKPGGAWLNLGRLLVMSGTLFQFVATIFLYRRRWNLYGWESLSIVDHRTFELAVGGATLTVMSIFLALRLPGFAEAPLTPYTQENSPAPEQIIIFCRGDGRRCPKWYLPLYISEYVPETTAATWLLCVFFSTYQGEMIWLGHVTYLSILIYEISTEPLGLHVSVWTFYLLAAMLISLWTAAAKILSRLPSSTFTDLDRKHPWIARPAIIILGAMFFSFYFILGMFMVMCVSLLGFAILPALLSSVVSIGLTKGWEAHAMFSQVPFGTNDEATECLLLWKDPVAEYLWSLV